MAISSNSNKKPIGPSLFYLINQHSLDHPSLFYELTRDYGDLVKIPSFRKTYLLNHPDYIQCTLQQNPQNFLKFGLANRPLSKALGHGLLVLDGDAWVQRRQLFNPLFNMNHISQYSEIITQTTLDHCRDWRDKFIKSGARFDISKEMLLIVLKISVKCLYHETLGTQESETLIDAFHLDNFYSCSILCLLPWLPTLGNFKYRRARRKIRTYIQSLLSQHQGVVEEPDIIDLLNESQERLQLSKQDIFDEVKTFLGTSHETTGIALSWTWFLLGQDPNVYAKLQEEINHTLTQEGAHFTDLDKLSYTKMVIEESLRLFPSIWVIGRKTILDSEIGGINIKARSNILVSPYALHRHPEFWERPLSFNPEHFSKENRHNLKRFAYIPFGVGQRICIASQFAMTMATLIIATIMQSYQIELVNKEHPEFEHIISLRPKNGIWVRARTRES